MNRKLRWVGFGALLMVAVGCGGVGNSSAARYAGAWTGTWQRLDSSSNGTITVTFDKEGHGTGTMTHSSEGSGTLLEASIQGSGKISLVGIFGVDSRRYAGKLDLNGEELSGTIEELQGDTNFPAEFSLTRG